MTSLGFMRGAAVAVVALLSVDTAFAQSKPPTAAAAAPAAPAVPAPVPMVVDVDLIQQKSKAAEDVERQLTQQQQAYEKQLSSREAQLRQTQQDLAKQQAKMSPDVFEQKRRDFEQNVATFQHDVQTKRQALDQAYNIAIQKVHQALFDVVKQIALERHANLVLIRSQLILFANAYDATDEALDDLNKTLPKVKVVIPKVTDTDAAQAAGGAPQ